MSSNVKDRKIREEMKRTVSESGEELCPVCHDVIKIFAYGDCDHPICFKCSTRMRVLCDQFYCAICRSDLPKVVFARDAATSFDRVKPASMKVQHKYKIFFKDDEIKNKFFTVQEHRCPKCENIDVFKTFDSLSVHMRKTHALFSCDICVKHLKIFSKDRKFYDRPSLAEHRRKGDKDDRSYKGHPLCRFCDERYLDNDELLQHLRKNHYYCHFCESDGISNEYFESYPFLRDHFRETHFLCEEEDCVNVEFTNAFRDEIDLKAHKAAMHRRNLNKAMAKAARTLDIDINYGPRGNTYRDEGNRRGGYGRSRPPHSRQDQDWDASEVQRAVAASLNHGASAVSVVDRTALDLAGISSRPSSGQQSRTQDRPSENGRSEPRRQESDRRPKGQKGEARRTNDRPAENSRSSVPDRQRKGLSGGSGARNSPDAQKRMYKEEVQRQQAAMERLGSNVRGMRDDEDLDSEKETSGYRAVPAKTEEPKAEKAEPTRTESPVPTPASVSLADKVKLANNFSVQSGSMDDFPSLGGAPQSAGDSTEDFPALPGKAKSSVYSARKQSSLVKSARPVEDFPALGGSKPVPTNTKPQNTQSKTPSWSKGPAAPVVNTSVRNSNTGPVVVAASKRPQNNPTQRNSTASNFEDDSDFLSLSSIGNSLLRGHKVSGNSSDILSKFSSASATQPVASNVQVIKAKPEEPKPIVQPASKAKLTANDFPGLSNSGDDLGDFPALGGQVASSVNEPSWVASQVIPKPSNGMLSLKVKSNKTPAPPPDIALAPKGTQSSAADTVIRVDLPPKSKKSKKKNKSAKGNNDSAAPAKAEEFETVGRAKEPVKPVDPVKAFLEHLNEVEKDQDDNENDDPKDTESNKSKKKKKKKAKKTNENETESETFFPGPVSKSNDSFSISTVASTNVSRTNPVSDNTKGSGSNDFVAGDWEELDDDFQTVNNAMKAPEAAFGNEDFPTLGKSSSQQKSTSFKPANVVLRPDDFPALGGPGKGVSNGSAPPPGFKPPTATGKKPPPGLGAPSQKSSSAPPPGFSTGMSLGSIADSILVSKPDCLETLAAQYSGPQLAFSYAKHPDFDERNTNLFADITSVLNSREFDKFRTASRDFRVGNSSADEYFRECRSLLGRGAFERIFPELVVLLPDIAKQQDLLNAYTQCGYLANSFSTCPLCQQVMRFTDLAMHLQTHMDLSHFPALS